MSLRSSASFRARWRGSAGPAPRRCTRSAIAGYVRGVPRPDSPAWRYLTVDRGIPDTVVAVAVDQGLLREGPQGSMWAAHRRADGALVGWEERGSQWRGFATGGAKGLFRFGPAAASRVCVTEAAIDAMSLVAIQVLRPDTLFVSTGGGWSPGERGCDPRSCHARRQPAWSPRPTTIGRAMCMPTGLRAIAAETGASYARSRPHAGDWNEDLKILVGRLAEESVEAAG